MTTEDTITVFLADDHTIVREGLVALVSRDPQIKVVGQCGDGLKVVEEVQRLNPDVAVLDISMPGLNGLDVCRDLVRKCSATAVLILTMHDDEQFIARAIEHGASGYLLKEAASEELTEAVRRVAKGEMYLGSGISKQSLHRAMRAGNDPYESLTTRERQVLQLIAEGRTNRRIAEELNLAVKTVDTHRSRMMKKLNIHDQTNLVKFALRKGIVSLGSPGSEA